MPENKREALNAMNDKICAFRLQNKMSSKLCASSWGIWFAQECVGTVLVLH
jgi:hypothetical protein